MEPLVQQGGPLVRQKEPQEVLPSGEAQLGTLVSFIVPALLWSLFTWCFDGLESFPFAGPLAKVGLGWC